jgi:hypothetical protein
MEEHATQRGGHGDVPPTRPVIERRRQHRKRGNAVEDDRDSEPEEGHEGRFAR